MYLTCEQTVYGISPRAKSTVKTARWSACGNNGSTHIASRQQSTATTYGIKDNYSNHTITIFDMTLSGKCFRLYTYIV